ncbi:MAG: hypothetical protein JWM24_1667 [Solirubrobacterales bacterium]|nr:hypothetical protein [Solirubrobacterales bacterium]
MIPQLDPMLAIVVLAGGAWLAVSAIVIAACMSAARADAEMEAEDEAVAMAGPLGWLLSQTSPRNDVADGPQQDLHIPPERPVRHI